MKERRATEAWFSGYKGWFQKWEVATFKIGLQPLLQQKNKIIKEEEEGEAGW